MDKTNFNIAAFKAQMKRNEAADKLKNNKTDLSGYRNILAEYLSYRNEVDDEYVWLQEALGELPDQPDDDLRSYRSTLLNVVNQMLGYHDKNFDKTHLRGIRTSLTGM